MGETYFFRLRKCLKRAGKCGIMIADMEKEVERKFVDIYVGEIPERVEPVPLYPPMRWEEISACQDERVRREKYCVWKLLGYALKKSFGVEISALPFEKLATGKWQTEGYYFSLSHSGKLAVVAVANNRVGIDVQKSSEKLLRLTDKILTEREKSDYMKSGGDKGAFLLRTWALKESIFKAFGKSGFVPREIDSHAYVGICDERAFADEKYVIAVATDGQASSCWTFVEGYLET